MTPERRKQVSSLVAMGDYAAAVRACEPDRPWRGGLRTILPHLHHSDEDQRALRAEVLALLGELSSADELLAELRPDHGRACAARATVYAARGDKARAAAARHAAESFRGG